MRDSQRHSNSHTIDFKEDSFAKQGWSIEYRASAPGLRPSRWYTSKEHAVTALNGQASLKSLPINEADVLIERRMKRA